MVEFLGSEKTSFLTGDITAIRDFNSDAKITTANTKTGGFQGSPQLEVINIVKKNLCKISPNIPPAILPVTA